MPKDAEKARDLRERVTAATRGLCERGHDADSCHSLAGMYERGEGVARDAAQAVAFSAEARKSRHEQACRDEKRLREAGRQQGSEPAFGPERQELAGVGGTVQPFFRSLQDRLAEWRSLLATRILTLRYGGTRFSLCAPSLAALASARR